MADILRVLYLVPQCKVLRLQLCMEAIRSRGVDDRREKGPSNEVNGSKDKRSRK